jgi:hypothetical protein
MTTWNFVKEEVENGEKNVKEGSCNEELIASIRRNYSRSD